MNVLLDFASPIFASVLLIAASGLATAPAIAQPAQLAPQMPAPIQLAQVTIEQRVIIRIPTVPLPRAAMPGQRGAAIAPPMPPQFPDSPSLKEVKGPKCLKLERIRGAVVNMESGITLMTDRDERFRTHFGRMCRAADFYAGFYIEPNKDGSVCAGRDLLHARNGSSCDIERFAKLVPDE